MSTSPENDEAIVVRKASVHNLRDVNITIPRDQFTVITGPSGSGKSSLAFDTIYAEGQRRYVESLSAYARQFLDQMSKPEVESITGLSPTISIQQKTTSYNPRSTVGTVTELYDYLRLLYARISNPICWKCRRPIQSQSQQQIVDQILTSTEGARIGILAPIVKGRKGEHQRELLGLRQRGFVRVLIDGEMLELTDEIRLDGKKKHQVDVYVDRLIVKGDRDNLSTRVSESVEMALRLGEGQLFVQDFKTNEIQLFSEKFACTFCKVSYPEPEPRTFSFNSPMGACFDCDGLGIDPDSLYEDEEEDSDERDPLERAEDDVVICETCNGARLRKESLHYLIGGKNIFELCELAVTDLKTFVLGLELNDREAMIASRILKEISDRLDFLHRVGVSYLSLSRSAKTLSGGEAQRIRLATQIGSSLVGVIYVLDEPSIGLHARDHRKLLDTLWRLRDLGNTVIVVEHDRETIERADYLVDLGPGAGSRGGKIVAAGSLNKVTNDKKSLTGKYLRGDLEIPVPKTRRKKKKGKSIKISGLCENNLKNIDVEFPLGLFTCVTGVSGSGKSTLVIDTLFKLLAKKIYKTKIPKIVTKSMSGMDGLDKVIDIDQAPIGKTPRSNPATYTGLFSHIRNLYTQLPESQVRGYKAGRFSFNVKGGRCETCQGGGMTKVEMHFLPNVYVRCESCQGRRYNRETLEITYKGKNIADVLSLTAADALTFFDAVPFIKRRLQVLNDVGLGYIQLGQSATTLSGGEAQRIKLSRELSRRGTGNTVYILDEPSTGLHFDDVKKLLNMLQTLTDQGNTVIVIEHNLEIIKVADHIIDLGPDGGAAGGQIVASGPPEAIARDKSSATGQFLREYLHI